MTEKGQKFKKYSLELKKEAIRLHIEEAWTYRQITAHLQIHDADRVKNGCGNIRSKASLDYSISEDEERRTSIQIDR